MIHPELLASEEPPTAQQRLRAWWVRWQHAHGTDPDVAAHKRQDGRGLRFPVERLGERRALRLRTKGEPRC